LVRGKCLIGEGGPHASRTEQSIATDLEDGRDVAIKLEHYAIEPLTLSDEYDIYQSLVGGKGIPRVEWFGTECDYRAMVLEILGPSLEDLFNFCGRCFSLKTVLMLADQIVVRLQHLHSRNIIHRDIKPENFLMGTGKDTHCVYLTDFGLAWMMESNSKPPTAVPSEGGVESHLVGTANFASLNGHRGTSRHTPVIEFCRPTQLITA
jgi:casein kinase I homolog HRR25